MVTLIYDLVVNIDDLNYTLLLDKHKTDKNGKPVYETLGYYSTLSGAVFGARNYCVRKQLGVGVHTLSSAIDEIKRINDEFSGLLQEKTGDAK